MRCSDCKKNIKPVVALDIDGTLGDYHAHFIKFAECWLGHGLPGHTTYDGRDKFWAHLGLELPLYREIKLAYRQGGAKRTMPPYEGAAQLSRSLKAVGAEIWICTTRPHLRLDNIDPDTREWLRRNGIEYDHMVYGDDKYQQLEELVETDRIVGTLDDLPEQYEDAESLGFRPILRENYHNQKFLWDRVGSIVSARDLSVAGRALTGRVLEWMRQHNIV